MKSRWNFRRGSISDRRDRGRESIILGSVNLALGGKYQKDMIREGAEYGFVELTFSIEKEEQIQKLHRLEVYPEDGMITLSRRLMRGRSVSRINGETVPISLLKEVAEILIDIHGSMSISPFCTKRII